MSGRIENGWFYEKNSFFGGHTQAIKVDEVLHDARSEFQDILVFTNKLYGTVLVLDGAVQCTTMDEFAYQEMISFLPVNCHPSPKKILVIGGGDGGVLRELAKHPLVEEVHLCELDQGVIDASKKFLPQMAVGFTHKKVKIFVQDGFKFLKENKNVYDIIICDLSDPDGPSQMLYTMEALQLIKECLKENGIACLQGECFWLQLSLIENLMEGARSLFKNVKYASAYTPTYPCGQLGFILISKDEKTQLDTPLHLHTDQLDLKYYSKKVHEASFCLPKCFEQKLNK